MTFGYALVNARRVWFVSGFEVWGQPVAAEIDMLVIEQIGAVKSIGFNSLPLSDSAQQVAFADLIDHRGNYLPEKLSSARVFVRPNAVQTAFITGTETTTHFTIARDPTSDGPVIVDLLVIEFGS
jgi:hypothetical protein